MTQKTILVTGAAGFIGYHLSKKLCEAGHAVFGIDNLNDYYDVRLKNDRLDILKKYEQFIFSEISIEDNQSLIQLFENHSFDYVVNLAAQAGVRYSITNPSAYITSNIVGFANILEACKKFNIKHFLYASSSSVYGGNTQVPFSVSHSVDHPISLYAASKKSNELMAHTYSHLFNLPTTGLRFFTVYGPYGRPDMALFLFTKAITDGKPINVYNHGNMRRDFTYIDDIVEAIVKLLGHIPNSESLSLKNNSDPASSWAPYKVFNIGNNQPITLMSFIESIEKALGKTAEKNYMDIQPGDMLETFADVSALEEAIQFKPSTEIQDGVDRFVEWYLKYYNISF